MDFAIVSGSDSGYYHLLKDMLDSVRRFVHAPTCIIDVGLTPTQREELQDHGCSIVDARWDISVAKTTLTRDYKREALDNRFKSYTSRPFLPDYVPDAETLLWIDADCWIQDSSVIDWYLRGARDGKLAITLEMDRCYSSPFWRYRQLIKECIEAFGPREGFRLGKKLPANSGIFALHAEAPHWKLWQNAIRRSMRWFPAQRKEQIALNYVIWIDEAPTAFLPATFNWMVWEARPLFDERAHELIEPHPPHSRIGVLHLATGISGKTFRVETTSGGFRDATLRYADWRDLVAEPARRAEGLVASVG